MPLSLDPTRRPGEFVFATLDELPADVHAFATVLEDEGRSVVLERAAADALGIEYDFVAAWITLGVASALDELGLTARFAGALAERGIACNVIAGRHHDHVLVPIARADETLEVLRSLS